MFPEMQLWLKIVLALALAFIIGFAATPIVKSFAVKVGAMDVPKDERRVHDHPIPRMGGMAIFLGFLLSVVLFVPIDRQMQGILIGCVIIVAACAIDDIVPMKWGVKLLAEIAAAVVAVCHGGVIVSLMQAWFPGVDRNFYQWQPGPCEGYKIAVSHGVATAFEEV